VELLAGAPHEELSWMTGCRDNFEDQTSNQEVMPHYPLCSERAQKLQSCSKHLGAARQLDLRGSFFHGGRRGIQLVEGRPWLRTVAANPLKRSPE
jgi:hypothetical protein